MRPAKIGCSQTKHDGDMPADEHNERVGNGERSNPVEPIGSVLSLVHQDRNLSFQRRVCRRLLELQSQAASATSGDW